MKCTTSGWDAQLSGSASSSGFSLIVTLLLAYASSMGASGRKAWRGTVRMAPSARTSRRPERSSLRMASTRRLRRPSGEAPVVVFIASFRKVPGCAYGRGRSFSFVLVCGCGSRRHPVRSRQRSQGALIAVLTGSVRRTRWIPAVPSIRPVLSGSPWWSRCLLSRTFRRRRCDASSSSRASAAARETVCMSPAQPWQKEASVSHELLVVGQAPGKGMLGLPLPVTVAEGEAARAAERGRCRGCRSTRTGVSVLGAGVRRVGVRLG